MKKRIILGICIVLLLFCATGTVSAKTWYVDDSGGADFTKIQDAIDVATDGDTIIVYSGTYYEHVYANKQLNLTGIDMPVVDAQGSTIYAIELKASGCVLDGFVAQNSHGPWSYQAGVGIKVISNRNIISNNNISKNGFGILIDSSSNNILAGNNVSNNGDGIKLSNSNSNTLTGNILNSNGYDGIKLSRSNNNTLTGNIFNSNGLTGLSLWNSNNNTLTGDIFRSNRNGIALFVSNNNALIGNNVNSNRQVGIEIMKSGNNILTRNNITNNKENGIKIYMSSSNNEIYLNNLINNGKNVYPENPMNIWNSTSIINYTYNGKTHTSHLGNYWSDYTGSDVDNDGIGDIPYDIDGDKDNYPLMRLYSGLVGASEIPAGEEKGIPGFKVLFAIAGLLAVAYLLRR